MGLDGMPSSSASPARPARPGLAPSAQGLLFHPVLSYPQWARMGFSARCCSEVEQQMPTRKVGKPSSAALPGPPASGLNSRLIGVPAEPPVPKLSTGVHPFDTIPGKHIYAYRRPKCSERHPFARSPRFIISNGSPGRGRCRVRAECLPLGIQKPTYHQVPAVEPICPEVLI